MELQPPPNSSTSSFPSSIGQKNQLQIQQKLEPQQQHQQYALKWNDFQVSILKSFQHLRDEQDFVDVTLACDQRSFSAHKVVLSACSPYFRKLLKSNPCKHPIVILRDVHPNDMDSLLSFMYNGEVNVGHDHLPELLKTAQLLQIRGLTDITSSSVAPAKTSTSIVSNKAELQPVLDNTSKNLSTPITAVAFENVSAASITSTGIASRCNSNNSSSICANTSFITPTIQELKASSALPCNTPFQTAPQWDPADTDGRSGRITPPPQKRIKSADLFRAQHGISPERLLIDIDFPVAGQHPLIRERKDRSRDRDGESRDRDRSLELKESFLSQVLENNNGQNLQKHQADAEPLHVESAGEESNSSETEPSDRCDAQQDTTMDSVNGSLDNSRSHSFPNAFLGIQGLLAVPTSIGGNDFAADVHHKFGKFSSAPLKNEVLDKNMKISLKNMVIPTKECTEDIQKVGFVVSYEHLKTERKMQQRSWKSKQKSHLRSSLLRNTRTRIESDSKFQNCHNNDNADNENLVDNDDRSSSSTVSAISLTVRTARLDNETDHYEDLRLNSEQQYHWNLQQQQGRLKHYAYCQPQRCEQLQQGPEKKQLDYLDKLQYSKVNHQPQLTENNLMARTIAFGRGGDFSEFFQNTSTLAVAATVTASATSVTTANIITNGNSSSNYVLNCPLCEVPLEQRTFRQHLDQHYPRDSPICPVMECGRRFVHPNSVRNHMRIKHTAQWAKMKAMRSSSGQFASGPDLN